MTTHAEKSYRCWFHHLRTTLFFVSMYSVHFKEIFLVLFEPRERKHQKKLWTKNKNFLALKWNNLIKMKQKFIIEFNKVEMDFLKLCFIVNWFLIKFCFVFQELTLNHLSTTVNNNEVDQQDHFSDLFSYLNFQNDRIEFEVSVDNLLWNKISLESIQASYENVTSLSYKQQVSNLPTIHKQKLEEESDSTTLSIYGNFKNTLLNFFSEHKKEFKLTIVYNFEDLEHTAIFSVVVPSIKQK